MCEDVAVFLLEMLRVELDLHTVLQQGRSLRFERFGCLFFLLKEVLRPALRYGEFVFLVEAEEKAGICPGALHPEDVIMVADDVPNQCTPLSGPP